MSAFLFMTVLYLNGGRELYDDILIRWGVDPFSFPFLDTDTVLSAVRCLRAGVDVFVTNPCDVLGRLYDYSPLWLVLAKMPVTTAWIVPAGFLVDAAFLLSLLALPIARSRTELGYVILGILSSAVAFALERGNNDAVLFVLAVIAANFACRSRIWRSIGYAAALLAGLLKYYPMTLMLIVLQEKPVRFMTIAAASCVVVGLFLIAMGDDLLRALALIPVGSWFGDMFGSSTLAGGLGATFEWSPTIALSMHVAMAFGTLAMALLIGTRHSMHRSLDRLTESERMFLLVGGLLMLSCFFTAQNIGYRAMHLVLVLPALTALSRTSRSPVWLSTMLATVALLWSQAWRNVVVATWPTAMTVSWGIREALWWYVITMLLAAVIALLARTDMARQALTLLPRPKVVLSPA